MTRAARSALRLLLGIGALAVSMAAAEDAQAYPSSVIFAPTGETRDLANVEVFGYTALSLAPEVSSGASWFGIQGGIFPGFKVGRVAGEDVRVGGMEVGVDAINADLYGTDEQYLKPLANAKLGIVSATKYTPALAIGGMIAPFQRARSQNLMYTAATKEIEIGGHSFGTLTAGFGLFWNKSTEIYSGTAPFRKRDRAGLMGGYTSPSLGPFSVSVDYIGGTGEMNSTNAGVGFKANDFFSVFLGAFFANNRDDRDDGAFLQIAAEWDIIDSFRGKKKGNQEDDGPAPSDGNAQATAKSEPAPAVERTERKVAIAEPGPTREIAEAPRMPPPPPPAAPRVSRVATGKALKK
jgi:hypothetical protein